MSDRKLAIDWPDGTPFARALTEAEAAQVLDFLENDFVQSEGIVELAEGIRRFLAGEESA